MKVRLCGSGAGAEVGEKLPVSGRDGLSVPSKLLCCPVLTMEVGRLLRLAGESSRPGRSTRLEMRLSSSARLSARDGVGETSYASNYQHE